MASSTDLRHRGTTLQNELAEAGVTLVTGWVTNASNLVHAKTMPVERTADFVASGAGMSGVYSGYSLDSSIQFTRFYGAVGDMRLRLDPGAARTLTGSLAIGPADVVAQDGSSDPSDPRAVLRRVVQQVADASLTARMGHELEFVLVRPDGSAAESPVWTPYGLSAVLDLGPFLSDLVEAGRGAGISFEQLHAEYGRGQIEVSLPPSDPIGAADTAIAAKALIGLVAREHGYAPSFSPVPFHGQVGNGAHQHVSLADDAPLFAGGSGPAGMTEQGAHAVAGLLAGLAQAQAVLTGSVLSGFRITPGMWSGASVCWGTENREAAVRFLAGGPANPHGANVELKVMDPSANPYLASATILGLMLDGIDRRLELPAEMTDDPSAMTPEQRSNACIDVLSQDQPVILARLEDSVLMRRILGDQVTEALLAVRRHEHEVYGELPPDEVCEALRLAWTL